MAVPPIAPFPPAEVHESLPPQEWQECLNAWINLAEIHLRLSNQDFSLALKEEGSLSAFLVSFFNECSKLQRHGPELLLLRKKCFLLIHRILSGAEIPGSLLQWTFLANLTIAFPKSEQMRSLLRGVWKMKGEDIEKGLQNVKVSIIKRLDSKNPVTAETSVGKLCHLISISPEAGASMLTGSDFLDSLVSSYPKVSKEFQSKLVATTYFGLISLIQREKPNYSLLSDHLYSLKTSAEQGKPDPLRNSLLADVVTNTPLLNKIRDSSTSSDGARAKNIASSLSVFHQSSITRPKKLIRRKVDKGKGNAQDNEFGHDAFGAVHVHRMSLVSQVQDLFPNLGSGFIVKLLDEYNDNIEQATAHLLEDSLPSHLKNADRTEQIPTSTSAPKSHLSPRSTPPPQRRNVFDDDEFDNLVVDASRLHIGRKNEQLTADKILSDRSNAPNKASILSALAAFDSDDDERDDTYDIEDVGGTVDSATTGADEADADLRDKNEQALFTAYTMNPESFARDAATRRSSARTALKSETGMTDEAIEGWGIMMGRDPRRLRRLEAKFSMFSGQQRELASTAWRDSHADSGAEGEGSGAEGGRGGRGGFSSRGRGRGRGRGGGGRGGGSVAGPSDDKNTQASRQRKEANKGSRANHNRRDQRAKKMARGGFAG